MHPQTRVALVGATLLITAACGSGTQQGEAVPTPSGSRQSTDSTGSEQQPNSEKTEVSAPLEIDSILDDPCTAVTKKQINSFPGKFDGTTVDDHDKDNEGGRYCIWDFRDEYSLGSIHGVIFPNSGLENEYRRKESGEYHDVSSIQPIADHPALSIRYTDDDPDGDCTIAVGFQDDATYMVELNLAREHPEYDEPCTTARKFAGFVVENLEEDS